MVWTIPENEFQQAVIEYAALRGWFIHHTRPAMNRRGRWQTPIQGNPGFPDLVLARCGEVIVTELKSDRGKLTPAQKKWFSLLAETKTFETYLWRPADWNKIVARLL